MKDFCSGNISDVCKLMELNLGKLSLNIFNRFIDSKYSLKYNHGQQQHFPKRSIIFGQIFTSQNLRGNNSQLYPTCTSINKVAFLMGRGRAGFFQSVTAF